MNEKRKRVTLDCIAKETGLSKYSVSRAISGKSGVSKETREKVLAVCEQLGYKKKKPEHGGKKVVLFILPQCDIRDTGFWMKVIMGTEEALAREGFALHIKVIPETGDNLRGSEIEEAAGIIFGGYMSLSYLDKVMPYDHPLLILTYPPYDMFPYDTMHVADKEGAFYLTEQLIQMGHKKIGYYGSLERLSMRKRFEGVQNAADECGAVIAYIWDDEKFLDGSELFEKEILKLKDKNELPTLIICSTDVYAERLIFHLSRLGIEIPEDISVTGFNSDLADLWKIPLTSMGIDKKEYGSMAAHYLLDRLENPQQSVKRISIVPSFVKGETVVEVRSILSVVEHDS